MRKIINKITREEARLDFIGINGNVYLIRPLKNGQDVLNYKEAENWIFKSDKQPVK